MKVSFCILTASAAIILAACGGPPSGSGDAPHSHEDGADHEHGDAANTSGATPIPRHGPNSYPGCMEALGYTFEADGVLVLPDGSVFETPGLGTPISMPVALRNDEYECRVKTGLEGAAAAAGYVDDLPNEEEVAARNVYMIVVVQCLTERGWDIEPLVVDKQIGTLVYEHTPESGDLAALELDRLECQAAADAAE